MKKFTVRARVYCDYTTEVEVESAEELQEVLANLYSEISVHDLEIQDVEVDEVTDEYGEDVDLFDADSLEVNDEDDSDEN